MPNALTFSRAALAEIDRRAVADYHIPILVLMENAGRAVVDVVRTRLVPGAKVLIIIGPGNNGGDGLVIARHLQNAGIGVRVLTIAPAEKFRDAAAQQLAIISAMNISVTPIDPALTPLRQWLAESTQHDVVIDAMFGTGLSREVTGLAHDVISAINHSGRSIVAVDLPSGLDCDSGAVLGIAVHAEVTVSFCGRKRGFVHAQNVTGEVIIGDIGAPAELLNALKDRPQIKAD